MFAGYIAHTFAIMLQPSLHHTAPIMVLSDLHLSEKTENKLKILSHILLTQHASVSAIYLLGDVMDCWLGGHQCPTWLKPLAQTLNVLKEAGSPVYLMTGNHDFLISKRLCASLHVTALPDPTVITLDNQRILLTHGDILCTEDHAYQKMRRILQSSAFKILFPKLPMCIKQNFAKKLNDSSRLANQKPNKNAQPVIGSCFKLCADHQADGLIHGHTHVPKWDQLRHACWPNQILPRLITAAWDDDIGYFDIIHTPSDVQRHRCITKAGQHTINEIPQ